MLYDGFPHMIVSDSVFVGYAKYLCSSAVSVQVSHAYRNIVMTRARISLMLCVLLCCSSLSKWFLVWQVLPLFELESTSLLEPSSRLRDI